MYSLIFEKKALNSLRKLDKQIKERIWNKLQLCKENPFRYFGYLTNIKGFKLRIGDYRVIIDIDHKTKTLIVLKVDHRKRIYDNQ